VIPDDGTDSHRICKALARLEKTIGEHNVSRGQLFKECRKAYRWEAKETREHLANAIESHYVENQHN